MKIKLFSKTTKPVIKTDQKLLQQSFQSQSISKRMHINTNFTIIHYQHHNYLKYLSFISCKQLQKQHMKQKSNFQI